MCLHVYLRCSVEYSVDELHCCAMSTGSAKGEQLSKALLLRQDDRLRRAREEAGVEQAIELSQSADHRETIYFTLEETAVKRLSAGTRKLLIACVLSARILDLHTTQD